MNVADYAYGRKTGKITAVRFALHEEAHSAEITIIESGEQHDPPAKPNPYKTLAVQER